MDQISTISQLLKLSESSYRIFDMGRKVTKLVKQDFEKVEQAMVPYPYPVQGQAEIAIVFWQKKSAAPYIWFVKIPLDERGLLNQGARNHFIAIIIEALGNDIGQDPTEKQQELLKNNPYHFTPSQYKLASLNSIVKRDLKQNCSAYYEHCQLYFSGELGFDNWQGIAIQGLCDYAARIDNDANQANLIAALSSLPEPVFNPLCSALENQKLPLELINALINLAQPLLTNNENNGYLANLLRALSGNSEHPAVKTLINDIISNEQRLDLNVLVTISGRCWLAIAEVDSMLLYLEKLVVNVEQTVFNAIFQDLIALPAIRPFLLQCIRQPNRSPQLVSALGQLFSQVKG